MVYLLLIHALFASIFTLSKAGLLYVQPIFFVALRAIGSGIILLACYFFTAKKFEIIQNHYWLLIKLAFFQVYCAFVLEFVALPYVSSAKWSLLYALAPLMTALFSYRHFGEQFTLKKGIGFFIAFIGLAPIILTNELQEGASLLWKISFPELAILLSVISYAYSWIIACKLVRELQYSVFLISGMSMLIGGIPLLLTSPFIDNWSQPLIIYGWPIVLILMGVIIGSSFVIGVNNALLRYYSATFLVLLSFIDPLYVALYGWLFLNETVSNSFFISLFAIFLGLYIFYQEDQRLGYRLKLGD